ncbi:unnamed protein product [Didymodactylos carnosus]|uniref:Uncharacterized protein n=1 Tax=Didymodactylos carnosus TaxID=1234261 RepID=A0A813RSG3_9BILA|nr:unnamed protein product [Didymodactylos carnosus]CAF0804417.1 unnamed protein product [Didymodactylos carnosus]CAF3572737.1 unnamed protein product [Didymodactylos carnosus]CAF3587886.1 unnamed protein product [Didymodactylos carnosus]
MILKNLDCYSKDQISLNIQLKSYVVVAIMSKRRQEKSAAAALAVKPPSAKKSTRARSKSQEEEERSVTTADIGEEIAATSAENTTTTIVDYFSHKPLSEAISKIRHQVCSSVMDFHFNKQRCRPMNSVGYQKQKCG